MRKFTLFLAALCCCAMMNAVNYSLTIAGTTVTDVNKTDVLGDGKVSFDPATNTLTLSNATIQTTGNSAIIWSDFASTLTIMLKGTDNYISMSGVSDYTGAIHTMGRLLITSEENPSSVAELKIVTSGTDGAPAIWSYTGDIIIENPISVNLQGAGNGAGTIYSQSGGQLIIDGATVYMMPCRIRTGGTVIARSAITSPSDAVVVADGRIMRSGTSSEYSKTTQVVISSNLRRLIYGATPKNVGNKVRVNDCPATESQAYAWIELADYINLTATPAEGYAFTGWYDKNNQLLSIENPYSNHQLMTENTTLIYGQFEEAFIYTVVGSSVAIFGGEWDLSLKANDMDFDGMVYQLHKEGVYVPAGTVEYKVVLNRHWNTCWPAENATLDIPENATYDISFTYSPDSQEVTANAVKQSQDINATGTGEKAHKVIKDGQLLIKRNGKTYNALGAEVK